MVEPTQKKEVKLYILRDAAGDEGRRQYQVPSPDLLTEGSTNFPTEGSPLTRPSQGSTRSPPQTSRRQCQVISLDLHTEGGCGSHPETSL